ncbi:sodium:solute symporter family protein [Marinilabiliaceae bacterium JC017]|nr:sodium:solute symporter family protein [Marinilabiliaceae bacterium JC017]
MHPVDISIFILYLIAMLSIGVYFLRKNKTTDDYFVGGRQMNSLHIGLSVVATDVGGGFSIGLGGLGFTMGLSGSWLLFTGLIGAWLSGVFLIPKVYTYASKKGFLTFPQFLEAIFDKRVAFFAGIISAIGYLGFTSSQILAGAKLAAATFNDLPMEMALIIMGAIAIIYTALGGLKAVIYTDTIQWLILMAGLIFIALPFSYYTLGGFDAIKTSLNTDFLSLNNISWQQLVNWMFTIIPIWFIGMTLYQRIYAAKDKDTAQKGWFIAGLFEYPIMAFIGVLLGMLAKVAIDNGTITGYDANLLDAEMGLPILLKTILPVGFLGIVLSAYFSAIMSTADSCLMASSGNILTDVLNKHETKHSLLYSQILTFIVGLLALFLALKMTNVLELMLLSYSFMVSGLIVPVLAALFTQKTAPSAALTSMFVGGTTTLTLKLMNYPIPLGLDANIIGITASAMAYITTIIAVKRFTNS